MWWFQREPEGADYEAGVEALEDFVRGLPTAYPVDPARVGLRNWWDRLRAGLGRK